MERTDHNGICFIEWHKRTESNPNIEILSKNTCNIPSPPLSPQRDEGHKILEINSETKPVRIYASSGTSPGRGGPFGAIFK
jgi:hypothetical protein